MIDVLYIASIIKLIRNNQLDCLLTPW